MGGYFSRGTKGATRDKTATVAAGIKVVGEDLETASLSYSRKIHQGRGSISGDLDSDCSSSLSSPSRLVPRQR